MGKRTRRQSPRRLARRKYFFYAPPHRLADGAIIASPVTVEPAQIAQDFPDIAEMTGVVVLVYWSTLCPEEHHCDFTIIDHALDYWRKRGKKVILNVATVGHPMTIQRSGTRVLEAATPDWLLKQVATYQMAAPPIVPVVRPFVPAQRVMTTFPSYWDPRFLLATEGLVRQLARYDGNPALSKVRIGTGIVGEDNPSFDGLRNEMPGWSNIGWIQYCRAVTDIYRRAFTRSRLEFDIDGLGWMSAKGTPSDRAAAEALVAYFNAHNIFLAMNGFDTQNVADWRAQAQRVLHDPWRLSQTVSEPVWTPAWKARRSQIQSGKMLRCSLPPFETLEQTGLFSLQTYPAR